MTGFGGRLAAQVRDEPCGDCGGAVVPLHAWLSMPEAALLQWSGRLTADQARAEQLQPGDQVPSPLLCVCNGGPRAALAHLRGES